MNIELRHHRAEAGQGSRDELKVAATASAVGLARRFTETFVRKHGLDAITDTACLIASELATNAVRAYGPLDQLAYYSDGLTPAIGICLHTTGARLRIEVWDEAAGFPVLREASADSECGRGLALINAMTEGRWGWHPVALPWATKSVWAEICHPAPTAPQPPPTPALAIRTPKPEEGT